MGSRKKIGSAPTGARPLRSQAAGRTRTTASSGTAPGGRHSITLPRKASPEIGPSRKGKPRIEEVSSPSRKPSTRRMTTSPSEPHVTGHFWSDAAQAWRVEFYQEDVTLPGRCYQGSFYCQQEEDARELAEAARGIRTREEWLNLRGRAMEIAKQQRQGFIYRLMAGECETFR